MKILNFLKSLKAGYSWAHAQTSTIVKLRKGAPYTHVNAYTHYQMGIGYNYQKAATNALQKNGTNASHVLGTSSHQPASKTCRLIYKTKPNEKFLDTGKRYLAFHVRHEKRSYITPDGEVLDINIIGTEFGKWFHASYQYRFLLDKYKSQIMTSSSASNTWIAAQFIRDAATLWGTVYSQSQFETIQRNIEKYRLYGGRTTKERRIDLNSFQLIRARGQTWESDGTPNVQITPVPAPQLPKDRGNQDPDGQ